MLEHYLIGHCSPTLANLKTANLFGYRYDRAEELIVQLTELRQQLLPRGVELRLLQLGPDRALIYVCRFEKCRSIYCRLYREGRALSRLTVAA